MDIPEIYSDYVVMEPHEIIRVGDIIWTFYEEDSGIIRPNNNVWRVIERHLLESEIKRNVEDQIVIRPQLPKNTREVENTEICEHSDLFYSPNVGWVSMGDNFAVVHKLRELFSTFRVVRYISPHRNIFEDWEPSCVE